MAKQLVKPDVVATIFGVSVRRIQQLTQDGIIHTERPEGGGARKYDLIPTIQEYIQYLKAKADGKEATEKEFELKQQKMEVDVAFKTAQKELLEMKKEVADGNLIHVEDVKDDYIHFFRVFKRFAAGIPPRVSGMVSGYVDALSVRKIEKDLNDTINSALQEFVVAGVTPEDAERANGKKKKV